MRDEVIRLFPPPAERRPLAGLYLDISLIDQEHAWPLVYTNFIVTLDGRVSEVGPDGARRVPKAAANPADWRLYMELLARCDVVLESAHHLSTRAASAAQDLLGLEPFPDLMAWRNAHGLSPMPAIAAIGSPSSPPPGRQRLSHPAPILLLTDRGGTGAVRAWEGVGAEGVEVGPGPRFTGREIVEALARRGYHLIYSVAGPQVLRTLLADDVVDLVALTFAHTMIGGEAYDTLTRGERFLSPPRFRLAALHYDPTSLDGAGQLFALYRPR